MAIRNACISDLMPLLAFGFFRVATVWGQSEISPVNLTGPPPVDLTGSYPRRRPIYIGGFFPKYDDVYDRLPATVQTAIDHVNNSTGILDGYELKLRWEWTSGNPADALRVLYKFVYTEPRVVATWGPAWSSEALTINEVAAKYNLVQVGLANSPSLGMNKRYPLTIRIWEEENEVNPARVAMMKRMNWRRCGLIFDEASFRQHFDDLAELVRNSNITVVAMESVNDVSHSQEQVKSLKRHDARIVFVGFYQEAAKHIFCQMYNNGLRGPKYVWIIPGWYAEGWWLTASMDKHGCAAEQLQDLLLHHVIVTGVQVIDDIDKIDYHGYKPQNSPEQREYLQGLRSLSLTDNSWATVAYAYDALLVIALALNASIADVREHHRVTELEWYEFSQAEMAQVLLRNVKATDVYGLTDHVVIGETGARDFTEYVYIEQSQANGLSVKVATFNTWNASVSLLPGQKFMWQGKNPPVDGITEIEESITIPFVTKIVCYTLSSLGVILALFFLVINIRYRQNRAIKLSSPTLNNLIVCGCLFLYAAVFVYGLDKGAMPEGAAITVCFVECTPRMCAMHDQDEEGTEYNRRETQTTLLCIGISLAFGALFLKTYRIHLVWTNSMHHAKRVEIPDTKLMVGVAAMVTLDLVIILLWIVIDTTTVKSVYLPSTLDDTNPDLEIYKVPKYLECTSEHQVVFTGLIYVTKGLLMLAGSFLAWEMRSITIAELNDSRFIALSIYVVTLTLVITVPTLGVLSENRGLYFAVQSLAIISANTLVLCCVFVPKVMLFFKTKDGELKLHFGREPTTGGSKSPGSTLNMGPGQTSSLMEKLTKRFGRLNAVTAQLTSILASQEEIYDERGDVVKTATGRRKETERRL